MASNHLDDPVGGVVVTVRDVTARNRLGVRAGDIDRRHNALIESLADGLVMIDAGGGIVRVNEAFEVMFRAPGSGSWAGSSGTCWRTRVRPRTRTCSTGPVPPSSPGTTRCW